MTRVIVINHYPVLPAHGGGQQAVLGLALELASVWPTELVWTERKASESRREIIDGRSLTMTTIPNRWLQRKVAKGLRPWLGRNDGDIGSMLCSGGNRRLVSYLEAVSHDGDVLVLAHPWLWPALRHVLERRTVRFVYDAHNCEHVLKRESLRPSAVTSRLIERVRQLEVEVVQRADLTLACTQHDAGVLCAMASVPPERMFVGSKGVVPSSRAHAFATERLARAPGRLAIFVGSNHAPNNEAVRWIAESLAPACSGWQFAVAGTCGPAAGVQVRSGNVRILGHVDDLPALMAAADVALNPVIGGSGINMKLFDYLQSGLPVVSTPFGARGFECIDATGIALCERNEFASTLESLVADHAFYRRLSIEAVACVREHFTWPVVGRRLRGRIESLLAQ